MNELLGEKIDVIEWDEDPKRFIANSLSPSSVEKVELNEDGETALVLVPDRQLSLAIGREGQNARLAAKLTSFKIDIQGEQQYADAQAPPEPEPVEAVAEAAVEAPAEESAVVAEAEAVAAEADTAATEAPAAEEAPVAETEVEAEAEAAPEAEEAKLPDIDEEAELLKLEEELAALEREEEKRKEAEQEATVDVASDDLWQVGPPASGEKEEAGVLRFAEDIAGFREQGDGRRRRGGGGGGARRRGGGRR